MILELDHVCTWNEVLARYMYIVGASHLIAQILDDMTSTLATAKLWMKARED